MYFYDEWKNTSAVEVATVFLDSIAEDFIQIGKNIPGLERAVRFTEKARMLGLGTLGFHSYLQRHMVAFESFEANSINHDYFDNLSRKSKLASKWMAKSWGEPEWCKGTGYRGTHRLAIAPNMGSATIAGQRSQGIEPIIAHIYMQDTPSGTMRRINPEFLALAKSRGKFNKPLVRSIIDNEGSVQHLDWLTPEEKLVFRTAYEIDQKVILRLASQRQRYIDQAQSLNLFFSADESEEYIAEVHAEFLLDPRLKSLYYMRTLAGVQAAKDECVACT
jgi:ribonucleoside-diphosphate reductase alpha chain